MTFQALKTYCNAIEVSGPEPGRLDMLVQDSRAVTESDVFIAIRGVKADGHNFIPQAIRNGATVIITEQEIPDRSDVCFIRVENTRTLLGPLAQAFEGDPAGKMTLIGITGTNGKTTVATLIFQVLQYLQARPALLGTVKKQIGDEVYSSRLTTSDPIELAADMKKMVASDSTHMIMEVSSHALHQQRVNGITFHVAAFTNLSHDHLDYHKTVEAYLQAKKQLFDSLDEDALAIINNDDPQADIMIADCHAQLMRFGFREYTDDVRCRIISNNINGLVIEVGGTTIESPLAGEFNAYNIAEAFLICKSLGYDDSQVAQALTQAKGAAGRLERVKGSDADSNPVVMVDYAHTPDALRNISETLVALKEPHQKLHIIFGCGGNRDKSKRPEMARIAQEYADTITVTSDNPRNEEPEEIIDEVMTGFDKSEKVNRITDRQKAINRSIKLADRDTLVLIAGKGHETYQEVKGQRYKFDDREIAAKALARKQEKSNTGGS